MEIAYCEKWWLSRRKPISLMSSQSARRRHDSRKPYVALLGGADRPEYVVDIADVWVSVDFLDDHLRKYLSYSFKEMQPGRLFLKGAYSWQYEGDSDSESSTRILNFEEDGRTVVAEQNAATGDVREYELTGSVDENWETYPSFGEYSSLLRKERALN